MSRVSSAYVLVIWIGITVVFFVPRFMPSDPVESMLGRIMSQGAYMEAEQVEAMRATLTQAFGLEGTLPEQYFGFFHRTFLTRDFGPSLSLFPTPVNEVIGARFLDAWLAADIDHHHLDPGQRHWAAGRLPEPLALFARPGGHRHLRLPHPLLHHRAHLDHLVHPYQSDFSLFFSVRGDPPSLEFISSVIYNSVLRPPRLSSLASAGGC